jgi:hypothetical protein
MLFATPGNLSLPAAVNEFMEEHEKRQRDFERYNAILELTTDPAARAAIEDLIRQTCDRLSKIDKAKHHRPPAQNPGPSPASKGRGRGAVGQATES